MQCLIKIKISTKIITLAIINLLGEKNSHDPWYDFHNNCAINFMDTVENKCGGLCSDLLPPYRLLLDSIY